MKNASAKKMQKTPPRKKGRRTRKTRKIRKTRKTNKTTAGAKVAFVLKIKAAYILCIHICILFGGNPIGI